jgi:hypothetical protein
MAIFAAFYMTLIKSISGIRGTIGGFPSDNLTPVDIVKLLEELYCILIEDIVSPPLPLGSP